MEFRVLLSITLLLPFLVPCDNYRILGIFPFPGRSHFIMFERLMKGLAEKGHDVDVVSHFPQKNLIPRYNDLSVLGTIPVFVNKFEVSVFLQLTTLDMQNFIINDGGVNVCETLFKSEVFQNLKHSATKYDLVVTELFGSDCMLGFGHTFKAPTILMTSSVTLPWANDRYGNPDNPSYIPNYLVKFVSPMTLSERIINTFVLLGSKIGYDFVSVKKSDEVVRNFFGPDLPRLQEMIYNTSLIFVNSHFSINQARPLVPNFIEVGGLHIEEEQPLNKYFENLVNVSSTKYKGIIYFGLGSVVRSETMDSPKIQAFFDAFAELPYKVLWKATKENLPEDVIIPENIHFEKWMPQLDILCHPNTKLFVSHGGLMSTQEAIHCGVPRVGIPLFADQELNLRNSEALGLAVVLNYHNLSKEGILGASKKVLEEPHFNSIVKRASKIFRDRPMSALDTATYWVEYVIKYNGAPHLRSLGATLPWYQYHLLDVVGVVMFSVVTIIFIFYRIVALLFLRNSKQTKIKSS